MYFKMNFKYILFCSQLIIFTYANTNLQLDILNKGAEQYYQILKNAKDVELPRYGICWHNLLERIHGTCSRLTDIEQTRLALSISDCFLQNSGQNLHNCGTLDDFNLRKLCVENMSERAYQAFVQFSTHAQNICFYLNNYLWQEKTEKTIQSLSLITSSVKEQLMEIELTHDNLIKNQKMSLDMQNELVLNGKKLNTLLEESRHSVNSIVFDIAQTTNAQKLAIDELSNKLTVLQSWALGEVSWVESILYYVFFLFLAYILTSIQRTSKARLWIFAVLVIGFIIESFLQNVYIKLYADDINIMKQNIYSMNWRIRYTLFAIGLCILIYSFITYTDLNSINHEILCDIHNRVKLMLETPNKKPSTYSKPVKTINEEEEIPSQSMYEVREFSRESSVSTIIIPVPMSTPKLESRYNLRQRSSTPTVMRASIKKRNRYS